MYREQTIDRESDSQPEAGAGSMLICQPETGAVDISEFYKSVDSRTLTADFFRDFEDGLEPLIESDVGQTRGIGNVVSYVGRINGSGVTMGFSMIQGESNQAYLVGKPIGAEHRVKIDLVRNVLRSYGFRPRNDN